MTSHATRRNFLRGSMNSAPVPRPFGAGADMAFLEACTRCGNCAAVCPQAIITAGENGFPVVDVSRRSCTFCGECVDACKPGALKPDMEWPWRVAISDTCLSLNRVNCRICQDHCELSAIRFQLRVGGSAEPLIDDASCTGCGACVSACPADAISLVHSQTGQENRQ